MAIALIILKATLVALLTWPLQIYRNYKIASKTSLPIILSPLTPNELPWHLSRALFGPLIARQRWFRALDQTCAWQDKNGLHAALGPCFIHVSPGYNMLCTNDAAAIDHVFKHWRDFPKPAVFQQLDFFGPSVITVNGDAWLRHRKLTAPAFNDRVSAFVWDESLRQARDMVAAWTAKPGAWSSDVVLDAGTVALHVLTAAAFGQVREFRDGVNELVPGHVLSFREALRTILRNIVTAIVLGSMGVFEWAAVRMVLSKRMKKVWLSLKEFRRYMLEAIARERKSHKAQSRPTSPSSPTKRPNLLDALVQASDEARAEEAAKTSSKSFMSDDELTGNMFMFAFAGHETTATTISYALAMLSLNQDVQEWVAAELAEVVETAETLEYAKIQPRLKRTLAVMYETVRCYGVPPPWRDVSKTPSSPPYILLSNPDDPTAEPTMFPVPENTQVSLNVYACHTSSENFPSNPTSWNPRRWIQPSASGKIADEQLLTTNKAFFGWGGGPRICPGMKFAQVEFTAVLATLLTKWRVRPSTKAENGGVEDEKCGRENLERLIRDSVASLAVSFKEPEELCIRLVKR